MSFPEYPMVGLGVFPGFLDAELALTQLQQSGFSPGSISFLAKSDALSDNAVNLSLGDRYYGSMPSASNPVSSDGVDRLTGLVPHPKTYSLHNTGSVVAGGRLSLMFSEPSWSNADNAFIMALKTCGIPELSALLFKDRIRRGDCLVMVEGSSTDLAQAATILHSCQIRDWQLFTSSCLGSIQSDYQRHGVGVFQHYDDADRAIRDLQQGTFPMEQITVIARDRDQINANYAVTGVDVLERNDDPVAGITGLNVADASRHPVGHGAQTGALAGGSVGGLAGLLVGLGTLALPGIGPILLAGTAATTIATTLAGGAIGAAAGGLVGALVGLGIPESRARVYEKRLADGDYIVMVSGTEAEMIRVEQVLKIHSVEEWGTYDPAAQTEPLTSDEGLIRGWESYRTASTAYYPFERPIL